MTIHDRDLIDAARKLATAAHRSSPPYGNQPYIIHPAAVAKLLEPYGPRAAAAGWLHDTIEDTDVTLDRLRHEGFPDSVITAVNAVTRRADETYFDFVHRASRDHLGRIVKLADNYHNASGLDRMSDRIRAGRLSQRYRRARQILERAHVQATADLNGLEPTNGIRICDLDMSESEFWFFAIGHHPADVALAAFLERGREMKWTDDEWTTTPTVDHISTGWAIWIGDLEDWAFQPVPDNTTPGAFRATWLSGL